MAPARGDAEKAPKAATPANAKAGEKVYKMIDVVGTSRTSVADAIRCAVRVASRTVHGITWFQVDEIRGSCADGEVSEFQVTVKLGFRVADR
jgi:flavin-binding protein dodecin